MDNSDSFFGFSHGHKRTHTQMEHEGSLSPDWPSFNRLSVSLEPSSPRPNVSGLHLPMLQRNMPATQPRRYPGDGLDLRRPVSLSRSNDVIDLTADDAGPSFSNTSSFSGASTTARAQRPPRFAREIIDIDVDDEPSSHISAPPDSPEIEFISARTIRPPRPHPPFASADDDIEIIGSNRLPDSERLERHRQALLRSGEEMEALLADMMQNRRPQIALAHLRAQVERHARQQPIPPPNRRGAGVGRARLQFVAPAFNFEMVGFDMGLGGQQAAAPPPPTYDKPEDAPEGFTRSPEEGDELVCPNCGDELCTGESELKRQVWVSKQCGHVYCGECTTFRAAKSRTSAKGKEKAGAPTVKASPFKACVVPGCEKKVMAKQSMIQVFL